MTATWDILIPTIPGREAMCRDLVERLAPQVERHPGVCLNLRMNRNRKPAFEIRNELLESARDRGRTWFSFVDDDDLVAENYVSSILPHLESGADTIQFELAFFEDGVYRFGEKRSLAYHGVYTQGAEHRRDISHLSVTRTDLALPFRGSGDGPEARAEDTRWADDMRLAGKLKREIVLDAVLYFYLYRTRKEELLCPIC